MDGVVYVYRGVHCKHPALASARQGHVRPGKPSSDMSPEEHNLLDESGESPFTSWTFSLNVARSFANSGRVYGVVLRLPYLPPAPGDAWTWVVSPNFHKENEILLRGSRMDAEVIPND